MVAIALITKGCGRGGESEHDSKAKAMGHGRTRGRGMAQHSSCRRRWQARACEAIIIWQSGGRCLLLCARPCPCAVHAPIPSHPSPSQQPPSPTGHTTLCKTNKASASAASWTDGLLAACMCDPAIPSIDCPYSRSEQWVDPKNPPYAADMAHKGNGTCVHDAA